VGHVGERPAPALRLDVAKVFFLFVKIGRDVVTYEREVEETKDFLGCNVSGKGDICLLFVPRGRRSEPRWKPQSRWETNGKSICRRSRFQRDFDGLATQGRGRRYEQRYFEGPTWSYSGLEALVVSLSFNDVKHIQS
jgi:hypothetical protein